MTHPFPSGVGGYDYGEKTSYTPKHLGVDWRTKYQTLVAPKKVVVVSTTPASQAPQGGNTLVFRPVGEETLIRWLHLDKFIAKPGEVVEEGQPLCVSGNTGLSDLPHTHEDIWPKGRITLRFQDTINPHEYYRSQLSTNDMLRTHKGTIYALVAGYWVAIATTYQDFLAEFGNQSAPEMTQAQFDAFPVHKRTIK